MLYWPARSPPSSLLAVGLVLVVRLPLDQAGGGELGVCLPVGVLLVFLLDLVFLLGLPVGAHHLGHGPELAGLAVPE